jgi:hypothetical protein
MDLSLGTLILILSGIIAQEEVVDITPQITIGENTEQRRATA